MTRSLSAGSRPRLLLSIAVVLAVLPVVVLLWLRAHPGQNVEIEAPAQHFFIVTAVSLLAFGVAALVAVAALQIQQYRVLFLALGFMSMGGLFSVHALATPGIVMSSGHTEHAQAHPVSYGGHGYAAPAPSAVVHNASPSTNGLDSGTHESADEYTGGAMAIVGLSAFLSLLIPALLFGIGCTGLGTPFGWRVPFRSGALIIVIGGIVVLYGVLALSRSSLFVDNPLTTETGSRIVAIVSSLLFAVAAWRQALAYRATRQPLPGALALAFVLLIEAQVTMVTTAVWTLSWWTYHLQMLAAVALALGALLYEYGAGSSLRRILEGTLELKVEVGLEIENVEAIAALAAATEAKDPETKGHTVRVAEISVAIGRELST